jgi:hypothetical protein
MLSGTLIKPFHLAIPVQINSLNKCLLLDRRHGSSVEHLPSKHKALIPQREEEESHSEEWEETHVPKGISCSIIYYSKKLTISTTQNRKGLRKPCTFTQYNVI